MSPRLSVLTVVVVCLLSCGKGETTPTEPFTVTKTAVTLDTAKTFFGTQWNESADITIDFSGDAISFVGYFEGSGELAERPSVDGKTQIKDLPQAMFSYVQSPSGAVLLDASKAGSFAGALAPRRPVSGSTLSNDGAASLQWPVADDTEVERGKYIIRIASTFPNGTFHSVIRRNESTSSGTLDLNLLYVEGCGVTTQNDLAVQEAVDRYFERLETIGIHRGRVQTYDITEPQFLELNTADESAAAPFAMLMKHAKAVTNKRAANVFFVRTVGIEIEDSVNELLGISAGIPVGLGVGESRHSGVVLGLSSFALDEEESKYNTTALGEVMAHEIGHSIGLYHTTEAVVLDKATFHDLITDTPECPASADINTDKVVSALECVDFDATNEMFWAWDNSMADAKKLSPGQGYLYRHSVIVQGKAREQ